MENKVISDIRPFNMFGNLYFVGSSKVSVHIIKTELGLVMIDTGYPDMYEQILSSMEELSLDPKDICAIFHSHGHIDHFGCTERLKQLSGAKTYISRIDNDIVNGTLDLSWAVELNLPRMPFFDCDVLIEDGDVFNFGSTSVRCRLTPGHTDGVLSFFVNVTDGKEELIAAMHGGAGLNTLEKSFLDKYGMSTDVRQVFIKSAKALMDEKVDIVMGNHPPQNDTTGKLKKVSEGKPIADSGEWQRFLNRIIDKAIDRFKDEQ